MSMMRGLQRTEVTRKPSQKKGRGKKQTREIKISYEGYCVSQTARHLAKGKQKITSGKVLERYMRDVLLEWINRRSHLLQPPTQLQQCPS